MEHGSMQNLNIGDKISGPAIVLTIALLGLPMSRATAGTYLDSGHGGSQSNPGHVAGQGVSRSSLAGKFAAGNCTHCHEQHASIDGSEPVPVKPGPSGYLLFDDLAGNAMCNHCHDSSSQNGADNISSQIAKSRSHDPNSPLGQVRCNDCHDSHVATITTRKDGAVVGNAVSGPLLSVAGVSAAWGNPNSPPPSPGTENIVNATFSPLDPVTMEYQLCLKCHGGQAAYPGLVNLSGQINPGNFSLHPVVQSTALQWNNAYLRTNFATVLNAPWNANLNALMYCSDCHGSETAADPEGPHGSANLYMLKLAGPGTTLDNLCLKCHANPAVAGSAWTDSWGTGLVGDHSLPQHRYPANTMGCLACHGGIGGALTSNIHGADYVWPNGGGIGRSSTAFLVGGLVTQNYYIGANTPGNRYCAASCHSGGVAYIF